MKKKKVNKLSLQKKAISRLDHLLGGNVAAVGNVAAAKTNLISNCDVCDTVRKTQCKGDDCPNFSKAPCGNAVAVNPVPVNTAAGAI